MTHNYGTLRRVDRVEAEVVYHGVYLTFRLDSASKDERDLVEVSRTRLGGGRASILLDAHVLQRIRCGVVAAILSHREKFLRYARVSVRI